MNDLQKILYENSFSEDNGNSVTYGCLRPWEREYIEKERRKREWQPDELQLPLEHPREPENPGYIIINPDDEEKDSERGAVIIEL